MGERSSSSSGGVGSGGVREMVDGRKEQTRDEGAREERKRREARGTGGSGTGRIALITRS